MGKPLKHRKAVFLCVRGMNGRVYSAKDRPESVTKANVLRFKLAVLSALKNHLYLPFPYRKIAHIHFPWPTMEWHFRSKEGELFD